MTDDITQPFGGQPSTSPRYGSEEGLLADLASAANANQHARPCQVCDALSKMSEAARMQVKSGLAGTIGERTLAEILTRNGYTTGRRAVRRHRQEGHTS
jgi:hypothetical protein